VDAIVNQLRRVANGKEPPLRLPTDVVVVIIVVVVAIDVVMVGFDNV